VLLVVFVSSYLIAIARENVENETVDTLRKTREHKQNRLLLLYIDGRFFFV
jgi:hypothetical protein